MIPYSRARAARADSVPDNPVPVVRKARKADPASAVPLPAANSAAPVLRADPRAVPVSVPAMSSAAPAPKHAAREDPRARARVRAARASLKSR